MLGPTPSKCFCFGCILCAKATVSGHRRQRHNANAGEATELMGTAEKSKTFTVSSLFSNFNPSLIPSLGANIGGNALGECQPSEKRNVFFPLRRLPSSAHPKAIRCPKFGSLCLRRVAIQFDDWFGSAGRDQLIQEPTLIIICESRNVLSSSIGHLVTKMGNWANAAPNIRHISLSSSL
ncbi:hypothetical protein niasHT_039828 [Heterodera trifolii]|uniref:C2H2-type domain-containing protein n=1 Tax=Heterodera trifolii TaxID=157864 RepID=A0ABD2IPY6_9BILA